MITLEESHRTVGVYKWHLWGLVEWPELGGIFLSLLNTSHIDQVAALDVNDDSAGCVVGVWVHPLRLQSLSAGLLMKSSSYVTLVEMVSLRYLWDSTDKAAWASFWHECPMPAETQNLRFPSWTLAFCHTCVSCKLWWPSWALMVCAILEMSLS